MSKQKEKRPGERALPNRPGEGAADTNRTDHGLPGVYVLLRHLSGVVERRIRHGLRWEAYCPCHDDEGTNASLGIDYKVSRKYPLEGPRLLVGCRTCGATLTDVCAEVGLDQGDVLRGNERLGTHRSPDRAQSLPPPATLLKCHDALLDAPELLQYLRRRRGVTLAQVKQYELGWSDDDDAYTLPVYAQPDGTPWQMLVNVRQYRVAEGHWRGLAGRSIQLWPDVPPSGWVLLTEGEWDCLVALRLGLPAFTSTGGAGGWKDEWSALFRGRQIAICFDCDDTGRREGEKRAADLVAVGAHVKVVDLGLGRKEDLSDAVLDHHWNKHDVLALIKRTPEWSP